MEKQKAYEIEIRRLTAQQEQKEEEWRSERSVLTTEAERMQGWLDDKSHQQYALERNVATLSAELTKCQQESEVVCPLPFRPPLGIVKTCLAEFGNFSEIRGAWTPGDLW